MTLAVVKSLIGSTVVAIELLHPQSHVVIVFPGGMQ